MSLYLSSDPVLHSYSGGDQNPLSAQGCVVKRGTASNQWRIQSKMSSSALGGRGTATMIQPVDPGCRKASGRRSFFVIKRASLVQVAIRMTSSLPHMLESDDEVATCVYILNVVNVWFSIARGSLTHHMCHWPDARAVPSFHASNAHGVPAVLLDLNGIGPQLPPAWRFLLCDRDVSRPHKSSRAIACGAVLRQFVIIGEPNVRDAKRAKRAIRLAVVDM